MALPFAAWIETIKGVFNILSGGDNAAGYIPPGEQPRPVQDMAIARKDQTLVKRTLYQMTVTNNAGLQKKNRILTNEQVRKLTECDQLLCEIEAILGAEAAVHSGYRCPELNEATPGHAVKSQHMLCEAIDFSLSGAPDTAEAVEVQFQKIWAAAKVGKIKFGQLIVETANRPYGKVYWVHISIGRPYRDQARCGEVMRMIPDATGKPVYTEIGRV